MNEEQRLTDVIYDVLLDYPGDEAGTEMAANRIARTILADPAYARAAEIREALAWYGEAARLCRLVHSGGDVGRHALADDGGKRARALLDEGKP